MRLFWDHRHTDLVCPVFCQQGKAGSPTVSFFALCGRWITQGPPALPFFLAHQSSYSVEVRGKAGNWSDVVSIQLWSQQYAAVGCLWLAWISVFSCVSLPGSLCLERAGCPGARCCGAWILWLWWLKPGCASMLCFTQHRRCQAVILVDAPSATLLLPCY